MTPIVVCFSGRQASGKTTLSTEIAARLGWRRVSFGDYVRTEARNRGISDAPAGLQDLGASLIEELGWDDFCWRVLKQADWSAGQSLVVDGIRHTEALSTLKRLVDPAHLLHVHIDVSDSERQARLAARDRDFSQPQARHSEDHSTEIQAIEVLPNIADLVISGDQPFDENVRRTLEWICSGWGV